jgi:mannose-6-phosphate isomerase-like protein (cupin superfamily)
MTKHISTPYALNRDAGESFWFLGTLMTTKAGSAASGGAFTLIEQLLPPGFAPPPHIHHEEDEGFYLLEGSLAVQCEEEQWQIAPGSFVWLPRGRRHGFAVTGDVPARLLQITTPAGFERFAAEAGEPVSAPVLPPATAPDIPRLLAAAARHKVEILG